TTTQHPWLWLHLYLLSCLCLYCHCHWPTVSLAAPCLDADFLAIHHATGVDEDTARIRRAHAVQNIPTPQPRPEIGGPCISKGWLFGLTD
ncbi:hypothetical protein DL96DRAFT_1634286, partial [Flagelloscypha sp. PMI_526]